MIPEDQLREIKPPIFVSKYPEHAKQNLDSFQVFVADQLSVNDQKNDWIITTLVPAYNMTIKNSQQISKWKHNWESPVIRIGAVLTFILGAAATAWIESWFIKK